VALNKKEFNQKLYELANSHTPFVQITLTNIKGSAPQEQGAKALVSKEGLLYGNVGGGKVEAAAIKHAQDLLQQSDKNVELVTWNLQTDIGMTCGGEVQFFFEVHQSANWQIAVFGAGHVAQVLVPNLLQLECQVTCIDHRPEWIDKLKDHPQLQKVVHESPKDIVKDLPENSYIICMTMGHSTDVPILKEVLTTRKPPYLGVIGSQQKALKMRKELQGLGVAPELTEQFYCPLGLPIGNNTPAEISVSIIAQLLQTRDS
jgi:xanthine dehydrogenase accessory factor